MNLMRLTVQTWTSQAHTCKQKPTDFFIS